MQSRFMQPAIQHTSPNIVHTLSLYMLKVDSYVPKKNRIGCMAVPWLCMWWRNVMGQL